MRGLAGPGLPGSLSRVCCWSRPRSSLPACSSAQPCCGSLHAVQQVTCEAAALWVLLTCLPPFPDCSSAVVRLLQSNGHIRPAHHIAVQVRDGQREQSVVSVISEPLALLSTQCQLYLDSPEPAVRLLSSLLDKVPSLVLAHSPTPLIYSLIIL